MAWSRWSYLQSERGWRDHTGFDAHPRPGLLETGSDGPGRAQLQRREGASSGGSGRVRLLWADSFAYKSRSSPVRRARSSFTSVCSVR